jgi:hypothetical protein
MDPFTKTRPVPRNWIEKLLLWPRAYETKIWLPGHDVTGRGPSQESSEKAAVKKWNGEPSQSVLRKIFSHQSN